MVVYVKIYCFIIVYLDSLCIVRCKIFLVLSIVILCIVIVSNICNEQNSTVVNVTINILLFLDVYYNWFNPLYFVVFFLCQHQL